MRLHTWKKGRSKLRFGDSGGLSNSHEQCTLYRPSPACASEGLKALESFHLHQVDLTPTPRVGLNHASGLESPLCYASGKAERKRERKS
ncbi:hypothetical protein PLICRDRAFT_325234, partial [Plicaturopsis crispa FD-325 SS-3]